MMTTVSLAKLKSVTNVARPDYVEREGLVSQPYSPIVAMGLVNLVFNMSHRNEILVGSNQFVYEDAKEPANQNNNSSPLSRFLSHYQQQKGNIEAMLDKRLTFNLAERIEMEFEFPVFSLPRSNPYSEFVLSEYPQVSSFNDRLLSLFNDEIKISNQWFYLIFDKLFYNLYPYNYGADRIQLVYLPLVNQEFIDFVLSNEDVLPTPLDKEMFTEIYCLLEERLMSVLFHTWQFAPIRLMDNENGTSSFYWNETLTALSQQEVINANIGLIPLSHYTSIRKSLGVMLNDMLNTWGYLMPEYTNGYELTEKAFKELDETAQINMLSVAIVSGNVHLALRLLNMNKKELYVTLQYRHPFILAGVVYLLNQFTFMLTYLNEGLAQTSIYYENSWRESPMRFMDIIIDLTSKIRLYPILDTIFTNMLNAAKEEPNYTTTYPVEPIEVWEQMKSLKTYTFPQYNETKESTL